MAAAAQLIRRGAALLLAALVLAGSAAPGTRRVSDQVQAIAGDAEAIARIGDEIRWNETGGRSERLAYWAPGEGHASLGIGHFIWYPAGRRGPYRESFADLLDFLDRRGVALPPWSTPPRACPWPDRAAFEAAGGDPQMAELRTFLIATVPEQVAFMIERLQRALPALMAAATEPAALEERLLRLLRGPQGSPSPEGLYALMDYVNWKGEGTDPAERYGAKGWGLLQVLEAMTDGTADARAAFADAAATVLTRRVALAPAGRNEARWLEGWLKRLDTYRTARFARSLAADG